MAGEVEITFDDSAWRGFINEVSAKAKKADRLLEAAFMTHGFKDIIDHFEKEEGPQGKWPKRSPVTQDIYAAIQAGLRKPPAGSPRAAYDPGNKVLQLTGLLRKSLLGNRSNIKSMGTNAIKIFSPVKYSGQHDEGDATKNLPQRQFMWLSERAKDRMAVTILDLLIGQEKGQI